MIMTMKNAYLPRKRALLGITLLLACHTLACGFIEGPENRGDPLWVIEGQVSEAAPSLSMNTPRAALVWYHARKGNVEGVAVDVPINPEFPAKFSLEVYQLPPDESIYPGEYFSKSLRGTRIAAGRLVIYNDRNNNGKLDLIDEFAAEFIDYVVGPEEYYDIIYAENAEAAHGYGDEMGLESGLNILYEKVVSVVEDDWGSATETETVRIPLEQELPITLVENPEFQKIMCQHDMFDDTGKSVETVLTEPVAPADVPANAEEIWCSEDGLELDFIQTVENQQKPCGPIDYELIWGDSNIPDAESAPANWPCEIPT